MGFACLAPLAVCAGLAAGAEEPSPASADTRLVAGAADLVAAVQARLGADVRVLRLSLRADEAELDAQDPAERSHVDRYTWAEGKLSGPEPVPVGRNRRQLEAQLFALSEVRLAVVAQALAEAVQATDTEDGRVLHVAVERDEYSTDYGSGWTAPRLRVHVNGPRGGGYLQRNVDGKRRRVVRW